EDLLQFAHVASHDLKEPVRKVKVFVSRLEDEFGEVLPQKAKNYVGKIQNATDRMFSMIEGVLAYSTLSSTDQPFAEIDLLETISNVKTDLEVLIHQKNATISVDRLPVIEGAPVLIYQLFYNLINNSLKFSKPDVPLQVDITSKIEDQFVQ